MHYLSVGQKLMVLKNRSTSITFLSHLNLEAAPKEVMQLRRLTKSLNESLGPYLFHKIEFWKELFEQISNSAASVVHCTLRALNDA